MVSAAHACGLPKLQNHDYILEVARVLKRMCKKFQADLNSPGSGLCYGVLAKMLMYVKGRLHKKDHSYEMGYVCLQICNYAFLR